MFPATRLRQRITFSLFGLLLAFLIGCGGGGGGGETTTTSEGGGKSSGGGNESFVGSETREDTFPVPEDKVVVPSDHITPGLIGGNLTVDSLSDPKSFNWVISNETSSSDVQRMTLADLMSINGKTLDAELNLAKTYDIADDARSMTVTLRKGILWSDGEPFDADDVVFSWNTVFHPSVSSPQADLLKMGNDPITMEKIDSHTVKFNFPMTNPVAERMLDNIYMLPQHLLQESLDDETFTQKWRVDMDPSEFVTLGPFKLKEFVEGQYVVLERNPYYWKFDEKGTRLPYLDTITMKTVNAQDAMLLRFRNGDTDILDPVRGEDYADLRNMEERKGFKIHNLGPSLADNHIYFNQNLGINYLYEGGSYRTYPHVDGLYEAGSLVPMEDQDLVSKILAEEGKPFVDPIRVKWFRDKTFRKGFAWAVDRQTLVNNIFYGLAQPLWSHVTPGNPKWENKDVPQYPFNLKKAKEVLASGGYIDRDGDGIIEDKDGNPIEFTMITNKGNELREKMGAIVQSDLKKLGMKVTFTPLAFNDIINSLNTRYDWEVCLLSLTGGDGDPGSSANVYKSSGFTHQWYPRQPKPATEWEAKIDELFLILETDLDANKRKEAWDEIQYIVSDEAALVHLICVEMLIASKNRLGNFTSHYGPGVINPRHLRQVEYYYWTNPSS